ncbi:hypothetical protein SAMN05518849_10219 [Sphingobium sp. AP50]|nr:hypothetical protein SAMN05518849_10219 [Sphingobium sp. AP50]
MASSLGEAQAMARAAQASGRAFILTHIYAGYPMVRQMRAMVQSGLLGQLRIIQAHYAQDWLATPLEQQDHKQAAWRTDPARSGGGGALGNIGKGNQLRLSLFGSAGDVEWDQELPNQLRHTRVGEPSRILERGNDLMGIGGYITRLPGHHPEGYLEAFA